MVQRSVEDNEHGRLLKRMIVDIVHQQGSIRISNMVDLLRKLDRTLTLYEISGAINELKNENKVTLSQPPMHDSFLTYLKLQRFSFWVTGIAVTVALATIYFLPENTSSVIRIVVGGSFALFVPGYSLMQVMFPSRDLDTTEDVLLSIGLSLAALPFLGLVLNYTPWGITLIPIMTSLSVICIALSLAGAYRKFILGHRQEQNQLNHQLDR